MSAVKDFLARLELFSGLNGEMLTKIAALCQSETYRANQPIVVHGTLPDNFYLIQEGTVMILTAPEGKTRHFVNAAKITLGTGQSFGEMGLIDSGPRSATVKAVTETRVLAIDCERFRALCDEDINLGYQIMKNIAMDLSFKLRYRNLI